jgi:hypothetical protein
MAITLIQEERNEPSLEWLLNDGSLDLFRVIEESKRDGGWITLGCPWYAFVISPKGRRLITYVYPLLQADCGNIFSTDYEKITDQ